MNMSKTIMCCLVAACLIINGCSAENYFIRRAIREVDQGHHETALKYFNLALEKNSRNEITYYNRGNLWSRMGQMDYAINDYSKALEINKEFQEAYENRGLVWFQKGNYEFAISDYTKALQLNIPDSEKIPPYAKRAYTWSKLGNYEKAIDDYSEIIKINPNKSEAYCARAEAWYEKGYLEFAISDYTKAIQINPRYVRAIFGRANTWHEKKDYASAIMDYEKATEIDPQNAHIYNNYSWLLSTCPDGKIRDGTKALKLALKAIEINPDEALFLDSLAAAYAELGNFKEAVQTQKKAILLLREDNKILKEILGTQLESYKSGKPWREDVKREDWMRNYKFKKVQKE